MIILQKYFFVFGFSQKTQEEPRQKAEVYYTLFKLLIVSYL